MELRDLRLVVTLADELHFGRAAERLHVGQPALSQQLRRLERRLGVTLFERTTHVVRPTSAGAEMAGEARPILERVARLEDAMRIRRDERVLRLGCQAPNYDLSVTLTAELGRRLVDVRVTQVLVPNFAEARRRLRAGEIDVYLGAPAPADDVAGLPLRRDRFGIWLRADHPLASRDSVAIREVADVPLLLDPANQVPEYAAMVLRMYAASGVEPQRSRDGATQLLAGVFAVAHGGPSVVAPNTEPHPAGVRWVPFDDPHAHDSWQVMWLDPPSSDLVTDVVEHVRAIAREHGWESPTL